MVSPLHEPVWFCIFRVVTRGLRVPFGSLGRTLKTDRKMPLLFIDGPSFLQRGEAGLVPSIFGRACCEWLAHFMQWSAADSS